MRVKRRPSDENQGSLVEGLTPEPAEVWWYRRGAYLVTAILILLLWFIVIGPRKSTPMTDIVDPVTRTLESGVKEPKDLKAVSKELGFPVVAPDLRQLGGKLIRAGTGEFGGEPSAVMQYQYGRSVFLLYRFQQRAGQIEEMRMHRIGKDPFYVASGGAVSVVAWKDRRTGYYAVAAKATEKDLLGLAIKMFKAL